MGKPADSSRVDFPVFDSDNHLYETMDSFTRHLPEQYKRAIRYVQVDGRTKIAIKGQISEYIPNPTFEVVARPGAHMAYYRGSNTEGKSLRQLTGEPMKSIPAFREPGPRLALLDELGIDAALIFPTLASVLEERMMDDPELTLACIHALNQWMHEEWSFLYENRIYATAVINLAIPERAIEELDWIIERGAKTFLLRPAPVAGFISRRSPFLAEFDPFWARVAESGILCTMHSSDSGYARYANEWEGSRGEFLPFQPSAFRGLVTGHRPIMDAMFSAVAHGMLSRFPGVKIACIESGSDWVSHVIEELRSSYSKMPQEYAEDPVEVFRRQVWVNPFWEDPIEGLAELIGTDHILFGSDYPHPEGMDDPVGWADYCVEKGFSHEDVKKIMGGNLARLVGADQLVA